MAHFASAVYVFTVLLILGIPHPKKQNKTGNNNKKPRSFNAATSKPEIVLRTWKVPFP